MEKNVKKDYKISSKQSIPESDNNFWKKRWEQENKSKIDLEHRYSLLINNEKLDNNKILSENTLKTNEYNQEEQNKQFERNIKKTEKNMNYTTNLENSPKNDNNRNEKLKQYNEKEELDNPTMRTKEKNKKENEKLCQDKENIFIMKKKIQEKDFLLKAKENQFLDAMTKISNSERVIIAQRKEYEKNFTNVINDIKKKEIEIKGLQFNSIELEKEMTEIKSINKNLTFQRNNCQEELKIKDNIIIEIKENAREMIKNQQNFLKTVNFDEKRAELFFNRQIHLLEHEISVYETLFVKYKIEYDENLKKSFQEADNLKALNEQLNQQLKSTLENNKIMELKIREYNKIFSSLFKGKTNNNDIFRSNFERDIKINVSDDKIDKECKDIFEKVKEFKESHINIIEKNSCLEEEIKYLKNKLEQKEQQINALNPNRTTNYESIMENNKFYEVPNKKINGLINEKIFFVNSKNFRKNKSKEITNTEFKNIDYENKIKTNTNYSDNSVKYQSSNNYEPLSINEKEINFLTSNLKENKTQQNSNIESQRNLEKTEFSQDIRQIQSDNNIFEYSNPHQISEVLKHLASNSKKTLEKEIGYENQSAFPANSFKTLKIIKTIDNPNKEDFTSLNQQDILLNKNTNQEASNPENKTVPISETISKNTFTFENQLKDSNNKKNIQSDNIMKNQLISNQNFDNCKQHSIFENRSSNIIVREINDNYLIPKKEFLDKKEGLIFNKNIHNDSQKFFSHNKRSPHFYNEKETLNPFLKHEIYSEKQNRNEICEKNFTQEKKKYSNSLSPKANFIPANKSFHEILDYKSEKNNNISNGPYKFPNSHQGLDYDNIIEKSHVSNHNGKNSNIIEKYFDIDNKKENYSEIFNGKGIISLINYNNKKDCQIIEKALDSQNFNYFVDFEKRNQISNITDYSVKGQILERDYDYKKNEKISHKDVNEKDSQKIYYQKEYEKRKESAQINNHKGRDSQMIEEHLYHNQRKEIQQINFHNEKDSPTTEICLDGDKRKEAAQITCYDRKNWQILLQDQSLDINHLKNSGKNIFEDKIIENNEKPIFTNNLSFNKDSTNNYDKLAENKEKFEIVDNSSNNIQIPSKNEIFHHKISENNKIICDKNRGQSFDASNKKNKQEIENKFINVSYLRESQNNKKDMSYKNIFNVINEKSSIINEFQYKDIHSNKEEDLNKFNQREFDLSKHQFLKEIKESNIQNVEKKQVISDNFGENKEITETVKNISSFNKANLENDSFIFNQLEKSKDDYDFNSILNRDTSKNNESSKKEYQKKNNSIYDKSLKEKKIINQQSEVIVIKKPSHAILVEENFIKKKTNQQVFSKDSFDNILEEEISTFNHKDNIQTYNINKESKDCSFISNDRSLQDNFNFTTKKSELSPLNQNLQLTKTKQSSNNQTRFKSLKNNSISTLVENQKKNKYNTPFLYNLSKNSYVDSSKTNNAISIIDQEINNCDKISCESDIKQEFEENLLKDYKFNTFEKKRSNSNCNELFKISELDSKKSSYHSTHRRQSMSLYDLVHELKLSANFFKFVTIEKEKLIDITRESEANLKNNATDLIKKLRLRSIQ